MAELATAYVSILPSMRGFRKPVTAAIRGEGAAAGKQFSEEFGNEAEAGGKRGGSRFGAALGTALKTGAVAAAAAIGAVAVSAVSLEKTFSQTMAVTGATLDIPAKKLGELQKLAINLGKSTSFSAGEAADAMQELAKGGLSAATIQAGALEGTLTLAAAGGTDLATAAGISANALNTFALRGEDMNTVVAALAGGANASTASVESLGEALGQVGPGARNAGLDINETVGALAAFDNAGIKGSDSGTSLKTMLQNLTPQTKKAADAMKDLGLDFTDAEGNFVPLTEVSQQLQDRLSGLSESQRTTALSTLFGSDATRAATVLMNEGSAGLQKYIDATKDQDAAQNAASARMSGTAGALERLSGAWETFRLEIGLKLAPTVQFLAGVLTELIEDLSNVGTWVRDNASWLGPLAVAITTTAVAYGSFILVTQTIPAVLSAARAAVIAFNAALAANPIGLIVVAIGALVGALVWLYQNNETVRKFIDAAWLGIKIAVKSTVDWIVNTAWPALQAAWQAIASSAQWLYNNIIKPVWNGIKNTISAVWTVLRVIFVTMATAFSLAWQGMKAIWSVTGAPLFRDIQELATRVGNWLQDHVFRHISLAWQVMLIGMRTLKQRVLDPMWQSIRAVARAAYSYLNAAVFQPIRAAFRAVGEAFQWVNRSVIQPAWTAIRNSSTSAWNWLSGKVFDPLKRGIRAVGDVFGTVSRVISDVWGKIKGAAARPVNFIIKTVYTNGIKKTWDRIADSVGLDLKLPEVSGIKGYKTGGVPVLPGYTPGRDVHQFYSPTGGRLALSGGEAIMRPEFTRAVGGPAGVAALNAKARKGQAFANGGVFGNVGNWFGDAWDKVKDVGSSFLSGPAGFLKKVISGPMNAALGNIGGGTLGKIASAIPRKVVSSLVDKAKDMAGSMFGGGSDLKGGGRFSGGTPMGWEAMWSVVRNAFPGASLNSAFRPGAITAVGTPSFHGRGRAIDVSPSMAIFNWLAKTFPNSSELIFSPAGGRQLYMGKKMQFGEPTRGDHWDHVHWAMKNGGVVPNLYDNGGWLPNGGLGVNTTGKPEAVLTPDESRALKNGLNQRPIEMTFNTTRVQPRDVVHAMNMVSLLEV